MDELGGEDSNPQRQGQNLLCCQLHHPRTGSPEMVATAPQAGKLANRHVRDSRNQSSQIHQPSQLLSRRNDTMRPTATAAVSRTS